MNTENQTYKSGIKKGQLRAKYKAPKVARYQAIYDYILDCIDPSGYGETASTQKEKLVFIDKTFRHVCDILRNRCWVI